LDGRKCIGNVGDGLGGESPGSVGGFAEDDGGDVCEFRGFGAAEVERDIVGIGVVGDFAEIDEFCAVEDAEKLDGEIGTLGVADEFGEFGEVEGFGGFGVVGGELVHRVEERCHGSAGVFERFGDGCGRRGLGQCKDWEEN